MNVIAIAACAFALAIAAPAGFAQDAMKPGKPAFDAELAKKTGADENGMRRYVLVILKTGPNRVPDGDARKAMFAGHMANIQRLSKEGKLALAGPFVGDASGWRGLFVLAVEDFEAAKALVATDPVIANGVMTADFHAYFGSAALKQVNGIHARIARTPL